MDEWTIPELRTWANLATHYLVAAGEMHDGKGRPTSHWRELTKQLTIADEYVRWFSGG